MSNPDNSNFVSLKKSYDDALRLAESHYENFPVVSYFLPKRLCKHVAVVYRFARTADDFADEGNLTTNERIELLDNFENDFREAMENGVPNDFWNSLSETVKKNNLTHQYFIDLLKAFKQDVNKKRYPNFAELLDYCRNSANPVGRVMLEFVGIREESLIEYSDNICSALQLANFWQDVSVDIRKGRIYIPEDDLSNFNVPEDDIKYLRMSGNFAELMKFQVERTKRMFDSGEKLLKHLDGRFRLQIKMTISGGRAILNKIEKLNYNVLNTRPELSKKDYLYLFLKSIIF